MKAQLDVRSWRKAFGMVADAVPGRSPLPLLLNAKLAVGDDGAAMMATDREVDVRHSIADVVVSAPGAALFPAAKLRSILQSLDDERVDVSTDDSFVHVRAGRARFKLPLDDPAPYGDVAEFDAEDYLSVGAADLKEAIRRTMFAVDVESTKYALGGTLVEFAASRLTLTATDGRRLATVRLLAEAVGEPDLAAIRPVVPVKALKLLDRNIEDGDAPVDVAFTKNSFAVRTDGGVVAGRLLEGRYPRYREMLRQDPGAKARVAAGWLRRGVQQAMIATSDECRTTWFRFSEGLLTLSGRGPDLGEVEAEVPIEFDSKEDLVLEFDPRLLVDMLKAVDDDLRFEIDLYSPKEPAFFRAGDYEFVAQPLTPPEG